MMEGFVNANLEAVVPLSLRGPEGQAREVDAVIDTGFNGFLTLPPALAVDMKFPYVFSSKATLADGSEARFDVVGVTALWDDEARYVETGAVGVDPLVGMSMLQGHDLHMRVDDGGRVAIQPVKEGVVSC